MSKKKKVFKCEYADWCGKEFATERGLSLHKAKQNHYGKYQKPEPPEKPVHVNYVDLVKGTRTWGQNMTREQKKHPTIEQLSLGALFRIVEILEDLSAHLGKKQ